MNITQFKDILREFGLKIDCIRQDTCGRLAAFYTFEIGTGKPMAELIAARDRICYTWELPNSVAADFCSVSSVTNDNHEDYGKHYLLVQSFYVDHVDVEELEMEHFGSSRRRYRREKYQKETLTV